MDEIIKHGEGQVPVKVKLTSLPSVAQANIGLFEFKVPNNKKALRKLS